MPSTTFRLISATAIVLLLAALGGAIVWTVQTRPAALALPTPRPTPAPTPSPTPPPATAFAAANTAATAAPYPAPLTPQSMLTVHILRRGAAATAATAEATPQPAPSLLPAPTPTPIFNPATQRRMETDTRFVNAAAIFEDTLWLATEGGALAWSAGAETPMHYTSLDGLPGNRLTAVAACPLPGLGLVFGGDGGLAIFDPDGGTWRQLNPSNSGMRGLEVSALACDLEDERLLVGYRTAGIDIYAVAADAWRRLDRSSGLGANDVAALAVDSARGAIWVASSQGVTRAAGQDSAFYPIGSAPLDTTAIRTMTVAPSGLVWLGGDGAVYRVNGESWSRFAAGTTSDGRFPNELITGMAVAADGSLWVVDSGGAVCRLSAIQNRCVESYPAHMGLAAPPAGPVTGLVLDGEQPIYTTFGSGHVLLDTDPRRAVTAEQRLSGNQVYALAVDNDGLLWAATETGLQRFSDPGGGARLAPVPSSGAGLNGSRVLQPRPLGGMWVGGRGASVFDGEVWKTYTVGDGLAGELVQAIAIDGQGRTWLGTEQGLSIWNGATFFNITGAQGLPAADIRALAATRDAMWIGSWGGGLYRFADNQLEVFNVENTGLPSDRITALAALPDGSLLLGTDRGLALFAEGAVTPAAAIAAPVTAIALIDGAAWVATAGAGVFVQQGEGWAPVTLADGLPAATITAIAATDSAVWLGGASGGLVAFDR